MTVVQLLLLLSGDVELNPGPPKRTTVKAPEAKKEATKSPEEQIGTLETKVNEMVKEYESKIDKMEKKMEEQTTEIKELKDKVQALMGFDEKLHMLTHKIDAITGVYDDLHEKMHEIDKTRKNNLLMYGIKPDFLPEIQSQLEHKIHEIMKHNLQITREIPCTKIARMLTGPEVRGCRPVLIHFANWKDREEVLNKAKLLRGSNIYVTEDLSRKIREHRNELTKFMREIRAKSPQKKCTIRYDKLYVDNTPYVYDEERGTVVRYYAPEPLRSGSRTNYSSLDGGLLVRSTSFPSVNGESTSMSMVAADRGGGSRTSLGSRRGDYASTESLHLNTAPQVNSLPPTDENAEDNDASALASPNSLEAERRNAPSPSKIRSDEEVETLQLTKKEKKSSLSSQDGEKPTNGHCGNDEQVVEPPKEQEEKVAGNEEPTKTEAPAAAAE